MSAKKKSRPSPARTSAGQKAAGRGATAVASAPVPHPLDTPVTASTSPMQRLGPVALFAVILAVLLTGLTLRGPWVHLNPGARTWATITLAIAVQALPFLVLGVLISGVIAAYVPATWFARFSPRNRFLSVPVAGCAGLVLPGCECASVPVAQSLMRRGLPRPAALAFMLASPAVNPVVLVATAVAFYAQPMMVWARLGASLLAVVVIGWLWVAFAKEDWMKPQKGAVHEHSKAELFRQTVVHDLLQAGGFLVLGAMAAGLIKVLVPRAWFVTLAENAALAILVMAVLAIVLSLCSEADAFVAASFVSVSPTAQLVFMVVGPMVDIKLMAMQSGAFGARFMSRFVPLTLAVCVVCATVVGLLVFGR